MFAVIETGGKQYHVEPGQTIQVERLPVAVGDEYIFDQVLLVGDEGKVQVGQPIVAGAKVIARVTGESRTRKVVVWKYVPKERIRNKKGHRQFQTRLLIDRIEA